jgi:hypothetical protein
VRVDGAAAGGWRWGGVLPDAGEGRWWLEGAGGGGARGWEAAAEAAMEGDNSLAGRGSNAEGSNVAVDG